MESKPSDDQKAQLDTSRIKQQLGGKDLRSNVTVKREKHCCHGVDRTSVPLICALRRGSTSLLKDLIPCNSSTQIRKTGENFRVVMETSSVLVTLPSLWQALPLQRQVKWKTANSHSLPVSHYIWTLLSPLYLSSISHLLFAAPILGRQTSMSVSCSLSKTPQH